MESAYEIRSSPKGYVLIINNETFSNKSFQRREGSDKDFQNLKALFKGLGFKTVSYYNLKLQDFVRAIKVFAAMEEHWNMDCCILFIMTHGYKDKVNPHAVDLVTTDAKYVSTDWVKEQFNSENCRSLMNKPKIMFFEACRVRGPKGMEVKRPKKLLTEKIPPHISDMMCIHSCLPGYEAFTFTKRGSCFVEELCKTVKDERKKMHLFSILNKVDMNLRKRFVEKSNIPYQAVYIENWSFNKLLFLSSRALDYYKTAWATLEGKKKERARGEKPPASRPLLVTKEELARALEVRRKDNIQCSMTRKTVCDMEDAEESLEMEEYHLKSSPKGYVLIINNETFTDGDYERREGSERDYEDLKSIFQDLGFICKSYYNLKFNDFTKVVRSFAAMDGHWTVDCCILFIMTHGHKDQVNPHAVDLAATDNKFISTDWIKQKFNSENCKALVNKPKVMFFQACRDNGHELMRVKRPRPPQLPDQTSSHISDLMVIHSCLPGYGAHRNSKYGAWFVQELCRVIRSNYKSTHLIGMLNKVDMNLRQRFVKENGSCFQAVYFENWSFNKLLFLSDEGVKYYRAVTTMLEINLKKKKKNHKKPPATKPLRVTKTELKKALKNGLAKKKPAERGQNLLEVLLQCCNLLLVAIICGILCLLLPEYQPLTLKTNLY